MDYFNHYKGIDEFLNKIENYAKIRNISLDMENITETEFPKEYGLDQREEFYNSLSFNGFKFILYILKNLILFTNFHIQQQYYYI